MSTIWRLGVVLALAYLVVLPLAALNRKRKIGAWVWGAALGFIAAVGAFVTLADHESAMRAALVAAGISLSVFVSGFLMYRYSERRPKHEL